MRVEIAHDILAKSVYQKSSEEERLRLRVQLFVKQRYDYYEWKGALLTESDIRYIQPFLKILELSAEQKAFIEKSKTYLVKKDRSQKRRQALYVILPIIAVGVVFIGFQASAAQEYQVETETLIDSVEILKQEEQVTKEVAINAEEQVEVLEQKAKEQASFLEKNKNKLSKEEQEKIPDDKVNLKSRVVDLVQRATPNKKENDAQPLERKGRQENQKEEQKEEGASKLEQNLMEGSKDLKDFFKNRKKRKEESEQEEK